MKKIALISCVKTKRKTSTPIDAKLLYISDLFTKSLNYCKCNYDEVYILSAKYGLLSLTDKVMPYEFTLKNQNANYKIAWAIKVADQLSKILNTNDEIYYHCGNEYREHLIKLLRNKHYIPLKGVSFGNQLKFYKNQVVTKTLF